MSSVNKVILVGRLGQDPELRHTTSGKAVCNLRLATGDEDKTEWHNVVVWEKPAENCAKYLSKGRQVYVEGRLQTRKYEDKAGVERKATDVVAYSVQFLGGKGDGPSGEGSPLPAKPSPDEVPF